jgi:hypothetical protein
VRLAIAIFGLGLCGFTSLARAETADLASSNTGRNVEELQLQARPLWGPGTPATSGWIPYLVNISNRGTRTVAGTVQLQARPNTEQETPHVFAERAFSVAPGSVEHLEVPIHDAAVAELQLAAFDTNGMPIGLVVANTSTPSEPLLIDFNEPSAIGPLLAGRPLHTRFVPSSFVHYSSPALAVGKLERDLLDDRLLLPRWPAGYSTTTLVLAKSSDLVALSGDPLKALIGWVLSGGSLAIVVNRPEDLGATPLVELAGGELQEHAFDASELPKPPVAGEHKERRASGPSTEVREDLVRYTGGNLHATVWGSAASYGLGELHLLSFDPTLAHHVEDAWVQRQMLSLTSYAWDRNAQLVFPLGATSFEDQVPNQLRDLLDPSQANLWTIVVAGFLLVGYALIAGPLNFSLARRSGHGARALIRVPLLAVITSACLVLLGLVSKGGSGHAHRLTLLEMGAGVSRGASVRYRSFFTGAELMTIQPTLGQSLLDVLGPRDQVPRTLEITQRGAKIEGLRHRPWQTVFVREDGMMSLGNGVGLVRDQGKLALINGTGHDLVAALLHVPGGDVRFFPRVVRNAKVWATDGELVRVATGGASNRVHDLELAELKYRLERVAPGSALAWTTLQTLTHRAVDWWPTDVPVLLAQVDIPAGGRDANLPMQDNRLLLRVVGYGGRK